MSLWTTRAHELLAAQARILADALRDQDPDDPDLEKRYATTLAGDERKLRGIPVLARGCGSAIPGTQPLQALMAKQPKND
jgi:hypothetical protein